jgi:hypothetical protein
VSLKLRHITANNFRKFRTPVTIDGLTDGLNIVIEPNETGKSTLLEAIRAAFFVPHRSGNQLTRSYQPFGENVAPEVEVGFDVAGVPWTVTKLFLKSPTMEVRGPSGRSQVTLPKSSFRRCSGSRKTRAVMVMSLPMARSVCSGLDRPKRLLFRRRSGSFVTRSKRHLRRRSARSSAVQPMSGFANGSTSSALSSGPRKDLPVASRRPQGSGSTTLEEVRTETSRTYVGPVTTRAKRYIERLLPGSELLFADDLGLAAVSRGGSPEDCVSLSRGTREQLAVLTRLAIADLLREEGRPVSLILDDPLVYADDTRLDLMTEILTEAAQQMQVILLTCRERTFRHMTGSRLVL